MTVEEETTLVKKVRRTILREGIKIELGRLGKAGDLRKTFKIY